MFEQYVSIYLTMTIYISTLLRKMSLSFVHYNLTDCRRNQYTMNYEFLSQASENKGNYNKGQRSLKHQVLPGENTLGGLFILSVLEIF